jgi:hypothetical protein
MWRCCSAIVAATVDEEGRGARDTAEVGAVDVLRDPRRSLCPEFLGEAVEIEPQLFSGCNERSPVLGQYSGR